MCPQVEGNVSPGGGVMRPQVEGNVSPGGGYVSPGGG